MSENLFIYEKGACRGDEFTNKSSISKTFLIELIENAWKLEGDEDKFDEYMDDEVFGEDMDYDVSSAVSELICGGSIFAEEQRAKNKAEWLDAIKNDKPVFIEGEESDYAIATSPKLALETYALEGEDFDEESWG